MVTETCCYWLRCWLRLGAGLAARTLREACVLALCVVACGVVLTLSGQRGYPQRAPYGERASSVDDLARRVEYLERRADFLQDRQDEIRNKLTATDARASSNAEKLNWMLGLGGGIAVLLLSSFMRNVIGGYRNGRST